MNPEAADAATTPVAVDREWEKTCRCTADAVGEALNVAPSVDRVVAQAAVVPRAVMSERPS
ncbi:hypothetical protein [Kribbella kalugense]|uniref:hypothetical protein n=1 Tax=Kribbella kalugense TaxID=2512221 RepID=UPI00192D9226|nr:hypothetical protein [Kribbella kalugense]